MPTSCILFIIDLNTRLRFPIDSGAETSLIPSIYSERLTPNHNFALTAVYRSNIKTYMQKLLELDLSTRTTFHWIFMDAHVPYAILGAELYMYSNSPLTYELHVW